MQSRSALRDAAMYGQFRDRRRNPLNYQETTMTETVTPAPAPAPAPAPTTIGQTVDADLAALKARVEALEANVVKFWDKQLAWLKANWPHLVTWALGTLAVVKTGALGLITKFF
jgi:hypothetical protein